MTRNQAKVIMVGYGVAATACNIMHHWEAGAFLLGQSVGIAFCLPDLKPRSEK